MLCFIPDESLIYVDKAVAVKVFEIPSTCFPTPMDCASEEKLVPDSAESQRNPWTKNDIHNLIDLYKEHEKYFRSSAMKNDKVWQMISSKLRNHTAEQCKNKFKYLKSKYVEKKENMGSRNTGGKPVYFEYFDQLDQLFKNDPNITPICTAASVRGEKNNAEIDTEEVDEGSTPKKQKKSVLEKQLLHFNEEMKSREAARATRHSEIIERQDRALDIFQTIANAFCKFSEQK